jgi:hypothetical protein
MKAHLPSLTKGPFRTLKGYDDCGIMLWNPANAKNQTVLVVENHKTYRSPDLSHRRAVLTLANDRGYVVVDEAIGDATGTVATHFHLLPGEVAFGEGGAGPAMAAWTTTPDKTNVLVSGGIQPLLKFKPHKTRMSDQMGKSETRPAVSYELQKNGPSAVRFVTLLVLFDGVEPPTASVAWDLDLNNLGGNVVSLEVTIDGDKEHFKYEVDPARMQMSPPPAEFWLFREPDYIPFYNNFMPTQHVGVLEFPERSCVRNAPLDSNVKATCEPPTTLQKYQVLEPNHKDMRQSLVVSTKGRYLYCGIPKCGVSRWRRLSRRIAGVPEWGDKDAHSPVKNGLTYLNYFPSDQAHALINNASMYSFIIVRSPYVRLLSG